GETKVNMVDLAKIQRRDKESIDDYICQFRLMKATCMTNIPEYKMVQMAAAGLNYDIRKRMFSQHLIDMSQLAESARQIEKLNAEKDRLKKSVKPPRRDDERYYRNDKERYPRKDKDHHVALVEEEEYDD
ncbi:hypothetical protein A2U01_0051708, partial [Trifolium medium]|nr:hypothetical protein [Trifolium medium]